MGPQLQFQRRQEGGEDVDHEAIGGGENLANVLVHNGIEYDRSYPVAVRRGVDLLHHCPRFFHAVDIGAGELVERYGFELREQTLAKRFSSDAGAVRDKES